MKWSILFLLFVFSLWQNCAYAKNERFTGLYFTIVNSGSGGSILGHTFLTFCPDQIKLDLSQCHAIEYNLDINLGEKFKKLINASFIEKIEMFSSAFFRVYEFDNAKEHTQKYLDRDQSVEFYRYRGSSDEVQAIHGDIQTDMWDRDLKGYRDYDILDNNCVTKVVDVINTHSLKSIEKESDDLFDIENLVYRFPIFVKQRIRKSGMFDSMFYLSKNEWYSQKILFE
ncbi:PF13387 domain protein [Bacteriovorax sp. BSW11_IV]|uniref:lipoprotein N-acyltransferase Lnb domain-containing protein n=1 Tax=Bacteriovorax sp. BSW11_IV TaxID=1353529 RepID=UPI00038A4E73|nr:DUF4105 domain-containing protein [Bacteriovorax sp. BSW11_IV]EQC44082.1 PF13387 domain protein [Bacteriovorax sp. BSW11_IV]